jgi:hypothetical protein
MLKDQTWVLTTRLPFEHLSTEFSLLLGLIMPLVASLLVSRKTHRGKSFETVRALDFFVVGHRAQITEGGGASKSDYNQF